MKVYIEVVESNEVVTNRFNNTSKQVLAKIQGKGNRRLVNVLVGSSAVPTWIDAPGFKVECTFEDGRKGVLDARFLNILEPSKPAVEVLKAA